MCCAHTPQENGFAERMHRTLLEKTGGKLKKQNTLKMFWANATVTAAYIQNGLTCVEIPRNMTLLEMWTGIKPDFAIMRVFESRCWYHVRKEIAQILGARVNDTIPIRYELNQKSYKLWD